MFYLYPGAHTVTVSATDNVGNSATKTNTFQLHATSLSLFHNVQRACGESGAWPPTPTLITKTGTCNALNAILTQAIAKHDYPLIQGIFLVVTLAVLGANFLADLAYMLLDPRTRDAGTSLARGDNWGAEPVYTLEGK